MTLVDATAEVVIPVIDLTGTGVDPARDRAVAAEIDAACREIGFFLIAGHGVDEALVERMRQVSGAFFDRPDAEKERCRSVTGNPFRGWLHRDVETPDGPVRIREQLEVSRFDTPDDVRAAGYDDEWVDRAEPNVWPTHPAELEGVWKEYYAAMDALGDRLLRMMAIALELPEGWFVGRFDRQASYLSCNRYLAAEVDVPDGLRFADHTDIGSLTILHQDDGPGGLQVRDRADRWVDVPWHPGTFVVNLGDLLAKWTNDRWVATPHRVGTPPPGERRSRMSIPYFQHPNFDALIECIPSCASADEPPRWPAVLAGNWTTFRFDTYGEV